MERQVPREEGHHRTLTPEPWDPPSSWSWGAQHARSRWWAIWELSLGDRAWNPAPLGTTPVNQFVSREGCTCPQALWAFLPHLRVCFDFLLWYFYSSWFSIVLSRPSLTCLGPTNSSPHTKGRPSFLCMLSLSPQPAYCHHRCDHMPPLLDLSPTTVLTLGPHGNITCAFILLPHVVPFATLVTSTPQILGYPKFCKFLLMLCESRWNNYFSKNHALTSPPAFSEHKILVYTCIICLPFKNPISHLPLPRISFCIHITRVDRSYSISVKKCKNWPMICLHVLDALLSMTCSTNL